MRPNVSITPISGEQGEPEGSRGRAASTTGIEIIPLGQAVATSAGNQLKSKVRDLKRSLSEDDKRRLDKKEKRKREEAARGPSGEGRRGLLGVIERLGGGAEQGGRPGEPSVEISLDRLKTRPDKAAEKPKLKLTIKTGPAAGHERIVSPTRLDTTFQIPKVKAESPTGSRKERSPSTSPKHSKPAKITERFITDPGRRVDERKRSGETLGLHLAKSPSHSPALSPLADSMLEEAGLLL